MMHGFQSRTCFGRQPLTMLIPANCLIE